MNIRPHGSRTTFAMWMLIAVVDMVLLAAAAGPLLTLLIVTGLVLLVGGFVGARMLGRRARPETAPAGVRRRA